MLTRDQILGTADLKVEEVQVPDWGGSVKVAVMSGTDRDAFQQAMEAGDKSISYYQASLVVATTVGDDNKPLFTADDIPALRAKSAVAVNVIAAAAEVINGFGKPAVEAAEKNSDAAPSASSGSDSPAN